MAGEDFRMPSPMMMGYGGRRRRKKRSPAQKALWEIMQLCSDGAAKSDRLSTIEACYAIAKKVVG